jgi:hypothetical protein
MTHFISQSAPYIREKLKSLENGPQTPQTEILNVAFKVYNCHEENNGLIRRGEIRPNSRCWPKLSGKTPGSQLTKPGKIPNASWSMFLVWS